MALASEGGSCSEPRPFHREPLEGSKLLGALSPPSAKMRIIKTYLLGSLWEPNRKVNTNTPRPECGPYTGASEMLVEPPNLLNTSERLGGSVADGSWCPRMPWLCQFPTSDPGKATQLTKPCFLLCKMESVLVTASQGFAGGGLCPANCTSCKCGYYVASMVITYGFVGELI